MNKLTKLLLLLTCFTISYASLAQGLMEEKNAYTRGDTLRGTLTDIRNCYDVHYYSLHLRVLPEEKAIEGYNDIYFKVTKASNTMQVDLFEHMKLDSIIWNNTRLTYTRDFDAVFVTFPEDLTVGKLEQVRVYYHGNPIVAKRAPWDGGFVWAKDEKNTDWIGVACQGMGASSWWPNKDHQSEEPDSMRISCAVPDNLLCIANGNLERSYADTKKGFKRFDWLVTYPINNYNVSLNIGDYAHFDDVYVSEGDTLALDYYVLSYNLEKAKEQFKQVKPMLSCFERFFGKYPFWDDGYALVETPYLGMEHQSAIAYGNNYKTGYNGSDFSRIGLEFDYIIIHETGHEWWGNSITTADIADMWIHEGFCTYSEALYVECLHGYDVAMDYVNAKKDWVSNEKPIIGVYGLNKEGSGDMYNKGMLVLNTLRHTIADDDLWFDIVLGITQDFKNSIVTHDIIVEYINKKTGKDFTPFFDQYMRHGSLPVLEYKIKQKGRKGIKLSYRWKTAVKDFEMPMQYKDASGNYQTLQPSTAWQSTFVKKMRANNFLWRDDLHYFESSLVRR